jgi:hypothetical protein
LTHASVERSAERRVEIIMGPDAGRGVGVEELPGLSLDVVVLKNLRNQQVLSDLLLGGCRLIIRQCFQALLVGSASREDSHNGGVGDVATHSSMSFNSAPRLGIGEAGIEIEGPRELGLWVIGVRSGDLV